MKHLLKMVMIACLAMAVTGCPEETPDTPDTGKPTTDASTCKTPCGTKCCTDSQTCVNNVCETKVTCGAGETLCGNTCCNDATQTCDTTNDVCVAKATCNPACSGKTPDCDTGSKTCKCNATSCGTGESCVNGACVVNTCNPACSGETPDCVGTTCKCNATSCTGNKTCNATTGACETVDPCAGKTCTGETPVCNALEGGRCDCSATSCATGTFCNATTGQCVATDPCTGVTCSGETPTCNGGRCDCNATSCGTGKTCNAATGKCDAVTCNPACSGTTPDCDAGVCKCNATSCGAGMTCNAAGACVAVTCNPACSGTTPDCDGGVCKCNATSCGAGMTCNAVGACVVAACNPACTGETPDCVAGVCKCNVSSCGAGKACNATTGVCETVDPCVGKTCTGETPFCNSAQAGRCDCTTSSCTGGKTCNATTGQCEAPVCNPACTGETPDCVGGVCKCNATSCTGGKFCNAATGQCVATDPCSGVTCSGETPVCNGGRCDCNASSCTGGKTCDTTTGQCVQPDPCAGKTCSGETPFCNAAQAGRCDCTTTSCTGGKTCNATTGQCEAPVCNPACSGETPDCVAGACKCNATSCTGGKTCNATTGQCVTPTCNPACTGETPTCVGTVCQCTATSCTGGKLCMNGACVPAGSCDPLVANSCPAGQGCYWDNTAKMNKCATAGTATHGATCSKDSDCVPGDTCLGVCTPYCNPAGANTCGTGAFCGDYGDGTGYCSCNAGTQAGCTNGLACAALDAEYSVSVCATVGTTAVGAACTTPFQCVAGAACVVNAAGTAAACEKLCNPAGSPGCTSPETCADYFADGSVGICDEVAPTCDPLAPNCPAGQGCYYDGATKKNACMTAGTAAHGATCTKDSDCVPGDTCLGVCTPYCDPAGANTCGTGAFCGDYGDGTGYCSCNAATQAGCTGGLACAALDADYSVSVCATVGTTAIGASCTTPFQCVAGAACVADAAGTAASCEKLCNPAGSPGCTSPETCTDYFSDGSVGICAEVAPTCDVLAPNCGAGNGCYYDGNSGDNTCQTAGTVAHGGTCTKGNDCVPGADCFNDGKCHTYCNPTGTGTCSGSDYCYDLQDGSGACVACPAAQLCNGVCCPSGQSCVNNVCAVPSCGVAATMAPTVLSATIDGYDPDIDAQLAISTETPADTVRIELYEGYGAMTPSVKTGTFTLSGADLNYKTCGLCVRIKDNTGRWYMAKSGTVNLTSVTTNFTGSLTNVAFEEVTIAPSPDFTSTPVPGGCQSTISSMSFNGPIVE